MDQHTYKVEPLPPRLEATEKDLNRGRDAAHAIAAAVLGQDPGPMTHAPSMSHYVYLGADVVVKVVDSGGHTRLDREIALASGLPAGLGAPLLASGQSRSDSWDVRYACFTRMPGASPGPGLPGVDAGVARQWAEQAVRLLQDLHNWTPAGEAEQTLRRSPVHEGFVSRDALVTDIARLVAADRDALVSRPLTDGLSAIARRAPRQGRALVPVHADCDWGNWLTREHRVTALLDFERARFGEPADDWVLLAVTSGPHLDLVIDVIAQATGTAPDVIRVQCELRDAAFLAEDLRSALEQPDPPAWTTQRIGDLEGLIAGRRWAPAGR
jgi:hypothetical protein